MSSSTRQRPILDPSAIRTLSPGHALLLLRSAKPIMLSLRPWTARPDAPALATGRQEIETAVRSAAEGPGAGRA